MQDMPALSDDGENTNLTANQITYMKKKLFRLASAIDEHVKTIHPALSVGFQIHPTPMTFEMDISLSARNLPRQHLATIDGFMELQWAHKNGHGKEFSICGALATGTGRDQNDRFDMMPLNHRAEIRAVTKKISQILTDLQALPDMSNQNAYEAWLLLKKIDFQPWKVKKHLREHFEAQNRLTPTTPSSDMTRAIDRATQRLASNFRRRYAKRNNIFDNVDFRYNPIRFTMDATFTINADHAVADRSVKFSLPVSLGWKSGAHIYYVSTSDDTRIDITQTTSSVDIMQFMLDSGTIREPDSLFQKGNENDKTTRIQKRVRSYVPKNAGKTFNQISNDNEEAPSKDLSKFTRKSEYSRHTRRTGKQDLKRQIS